METFGNVEYFSHPSEELYDIIEQHIPGHTKMGII
jgi:hypothetical protein